MTDMGLFIFNGGGLSDEEVALGTPDDTEAKSLPHHVNRCALRYRLFTKRMAAHGQDLTQLKYMVLGLIALTAITNPSARSFFEWVSKII